MTTSTKPYILRALYDWCLDNQQTPHIVAWVNEYTQVPMQYVRDHEIVLNIGPTASHHLVIDNDWVNFSARFGGVAHEIWIPVGHIVSIFSRESGEGMGFEIEEYQPESNNQKDESLHIESNNTAKDSAKDDEKREIASKDHPSDNKSNTKKVLKFVK